jgi:tetratricopeptide (TPR) repeat protein
VVQISCEKANSLFSFLIDGESIPEQELQAFESHIHQCKRCRQHLAELRDSEDTIRKAILDSTQIHISTDRLGAFLDQQINSEFEKKRIQVHLKSCAQCSKVIDQLTIVNRERLFFMNRLYRLLFKIRWLEKWMALRDWVIGVPRVTRFLAPVTVSLLLIFIAYRAIYHNRELSLPQLADTTPYPYIELGLRSDQLSDDPGWQRAMAYYQQKAFNQAIPLLRDEVNSDSTHHLARFYLGVSYYLNNQLDEAEQCLLLSVQNEPEEPRGYWYLAQVYLKKNNRFQVDRLLMEIISLGKDCFITKAEQLIKRMEK